MAGLSFFRSWLGQSRSEREARQEKVRQEVEATYRAGGEEAERLHRSFGSPNERLSNDLNSVLTVAFLVVVVLGVLCAGVVLLVTQLA